MVRRIPPNELNNSSEIIVIDVREYPEFAGGAVPGAKLVPLGAIASECARWDRDAAYVLVCKSGQRSMQAAEQMLASGFRNLAVLTGGTEAWAAEGLPIHVSEKRPWSLERQVRIAAGAMILVSALLGLTISEWFFAWTIFVGAGLVLAAVTDTCMMASLLGRMPWNRAFPPGASCAR